MRRSQILVTIKSLEMLRAHGFLAPILGILAKSKLSVDLITTSEVSVALAVDGTRSIDVFSSCYCVHEQML